MALLHQLSGYMDAEMVRKRVTALLAGFVKDQNQFGKTNLAQQVDDFMSVLSWEPGSIVRLPAGADITFPSIQDASGNAESFIKTIMLVVAAAIDLPFELSGATGPKTSDRAGRFSATFFESVVENERTRLEHRPWTRSGGTSSTCALRRACGSRPPDPSPATGTPYPGAGR